MKEERNEAVESRDYLESLILDKEVIVLFEESDTTLDGINRGNFGRPIAYLFILDNRTLPKVETFVNQNMIDNGKAIRSKYKIDFPVLFTKDFDLSDIPVSVWLSVNAAKRATTTWAELKR